MVLGPDQYDARGSGAEVELVYLGCDDPTMTVEQVRNMVTFLDREQVDAWVKEHAAEPAHVHYTLDENGKIAGEEILSWTGEEYGGLLKPELNG